MTFRRELTDACEELGLPLSPEALDRSVRFRELLQKWASRISLSAVSGDRELAVFHFAESFWATAFLDPGAGLADVGSGAGFPGVAMALYRPDLRCALLERNFKKVVFLETVVRELGLPVRVAAGDAAQWNGWAGVEVASIRALKPSAALLARLRQEGVDLLHFRGAEDAPLLAGWTRLREQVFPASRRRMVLRYRPPPAVPRGTG